MAYGGKRQGAGRPKGSLASHTLEAQTLRQYIIQRYIESKQDIVDALIDKAKTGDVPAIRELHERTMGKVTDKVEYTQYETLAGLVQRLERETVKPIVWNLKY